MEGLSDQWLTTVAGVGVIVGLVLLARGMAGYRTLIRVGDTSTSSIASLAVGEVRVSGIVEPAELTLVSLLQSVPCVYYRSTVGGDTEIRGDRSGYTEERSIGFRVRDATGSLRVFPRGAGFDAPVKFEVEPDMLGEASAGLNIRHGGSTRPTEIDEETAAAALLTVDPRTPDRPAGLGSGGRRSYKERRIEPGDPVTIVGRALPFSDLADPAGADLGSSSDPLGDDPEVAADLAEARADGTHGGRPGRGLGQCRDPRLRDRAARRHSVHRRSRQPAPSRRR